MTKTGWYRGNQKPVRAGYYERKTWKYSYWNGKYWEYGTYTKYRTFGKSCVQKEPWRGITKGSK